MHNKHKQSAPLLYQCLLYFLSPVLIIYTAWQAVRCKKWRYFYQRLGLFYNLNSLRKDSKKTIWIHAASVGETLTVQPLVENLHALYPDITLVLTTVTATGADIAQNNLGDKIQHSYLPIDWLGRTRSFIGQLNPQCALITETELWPNLFAQCALQDIPLAIINARLSPRTLNTNSWIKQLYKTTLRNTSAILCRSQQDAEHYQQLGANVQNTLTVGNLKFSAANQLNPNISDLNIGRPYVVAASTHDNEEQQIVSVWNQLPISKSYLLIIVPRHPHRSHSILKQISDESGNIAIRSRDEKITSTTRIYLADTVGELSSFMLRAELIIMGGSFVPIGGHNILEPAFFSKAIIFGPHMHNFADETHSFLQHQAAIQVPSIQQLGSSLEHLLSSETQRIELGNRAKQLLANHQNIANDYVKTLQSQHILPVV